MTVIHQIRMCVVFSDKILRTSIAVDEKPHDEATDESTVELNASGINKTLESQASDNSTVCVENPPSTSGGDMSAEQKPKKSRGKSKTRPICLLCNKSFHTLYKLNEHHAVVHLDKRLFSCNVCQKPFGRADHLIRHVRNRVCVTRQHQQSLDVLDASNKPGNGAVLSDI